LLPGYPQIKDRKFDNKYGVVKVGDELRVRVVENKLKFD
jgi:hypothetical protein